MPHHLFGLLRFDCLMGILVAKSNGSGGKWTPFHCVHIFLSLVHSWVSRDTDTDTVTVIMPLTLSVTRSLHFFSLNRYLLSDTQTTVTFQDVVLGPVADLIFL